MEDKFNDLGVDALIGSDVMYQVGVTPQDLNSPQNFEKFKAVIQYLKNIPETDRSWFINSAVLGKTSNKIDHLFQFVNLYSKKELLSKELQSIDGENSYRTGEIKNKIDRIQEQILMFSK